MLSRLFPRPPLDVAEKAWVERGLVTLAGRLGAGRLGIGAAPADTLVPSRELPPANADDAAVRAFVDRIAGHLGLNAAGLRLEWFDGDARTDPNELEAYVTTPRPYGLWSLADDGTPTISLNRELRADPEQLAATVAHELCHEVLLGDRTRGSLSAGGPRFATVGETFEHGDAGGDSAANRLDADEEPLTDLAAAALGLGAFVANATLKERRTPAAYGYWWQLGRAGYLTSREIGYAMACLVYARGETGTPPWVGELRPDAGEAVTGGLRYLRRTGDTRFTAESARRGPHAPPPGESATALRARRPGERLAACWDAAAAEPSPALSDALLDATRDREEAVRAAACRAVPVQSAAGDAEAAERALLALVAAGSDPSARVRAAALSGLAELERLPERGAARDELDRVVEDGLTARSAAVRAAAASALPKLRIEGRTGDGPPFAPAVLRALTRALVRCDDAEAAAHAAVLYDLHPDPPALAAERVEDGELLARVLDALGVESEPAFTDGPAAGPATA